MKNELKYLKPFEAEVINKLRTEYINLNNYKNRFYKDTDGYCKCCNVWDNVSHLLFECNIKKLNKNNEIIKLRNRMYKELKMENVYFKNQYNITAINVLFPHIWLPDPIKDSKNYRKKMENNLHTRINILKIIVNFVIKSKRFEREEYGI